MQTCVTCAFWKTHSAREVTQAYHDRDRAARIAAGRDPAESDRYWPVGRSAPQPIALEGYPPSWGVCQRATEEGALMGAECFTEGIGGDLVTAPGFGCLEWSAGAPGDRVRLHVCDAPREP